MPLWLKVGLVLVAVPLTIYACHRLLVYCESRDWLYYRRKRPPSPGGGGGGVLTSFQQFVEPQVTHVQEEKRQRHAVQEDEAGSGR